MPPERPHARTDKERLAAIETEIGHLKDGIEELYRYLREEFFRMVSSQIEDLRSRQEKTDSSLGAKAACTDVDEVEAHLKDLEATRIKDIETRIRTLEKNIWKAIGALAILAFIAPYLAKALNLS
jgi:hypothetical protein